MSKILVNTAIYASNIGKCYKAIDDKVMIVTQDIKQFGSKNKIIVKRGLFTIGLSR